jgi:hypothetical protein
VNVMEIELNSMASGRMKRVTHYMLQTVLRSPQRRARRPRGANGKRLRSSSELIAMVFKNRWSHDARASSFDSHR